MDTIPAVNVSTSHVLEIPAATPEAAHRHFAARLSVETDCWDVYKDLERRTTGFVVLDARGRDAYAACHIPGAISLPHREIDAQTTAALSKETVIVTYCWGPACNAAHKAALRLSALGFRVKEMLGGLEYWRRQDYPVDGTEGDDAPLFG